MALQTKRRWAQLRVGLLAITALAVLAFLIFLMTSSKGFFTTRSELYTYLDDSAAIAQGAPVRVNGITAGKEARVALVGFKRPNRNVQNFLQVRKSFSPPHSPGSSSRHLLPHLPPDR